MTDAARCPECGGTFGVHFPQCSRFVGRETMPQPYLGTLGWLCPRCGRGNSPFTSTCPCVPTDPVRVSCGAPR